MAFSTKYIRGGTTATGKTSSHGQPGRGVSGASLVGAGLAAVLVISGSYVAFSAMRPSASAGMGSMGERLEIAVLDTEAEGKSRGRTARRLTANDDRDALNERIARAIIAMDDPAIAVLPDQLGLASVDKSQRLPRQSALEDDNAVSILREALAEAAGERTARLALAEGLLQQRDEYVRQFRMLAAAESDADPLTTASLSGGMELAYATAPSARDTLVSAENNPFADVLSGQDEGEAGILLPDDDIPLPTFRPELPVETAKPDPAPAAKPQSKTAYAKPDKPAEKKSVFSWFGNSKGSSKLPGRGSRIAVYDITNQVVYMPNGEKLEAHSGRGPTKDSVKYVHVKGRGSTPPNVYSLRMREALFHGVEAIRMTPVGSAKMYGRDGLLTHSYLRRIPGDSAGCVAFADYKKFLNAFKRGEVTKLIVVPSIDALPTYMAML